MPDAGAPSETHAAVLAASRPAPRARRRVLVTGASGMLGSDLVFLLTAAGYDVLARPRADLDITDSGAVARALRELRPDVLVNCAAFTKVDDCETDPRAFQVNAEAVANLADACGHVGAQLVQISTDFVFDGARQEPYREDDPVNPTSAYGRSKRAGEEEAMRLPGSLVVRASWLFGRSGWNFVEAILKQVETGKTRLSVVVDQVGRPTSTTDLSEASPRSARSRRLGRLSLRKPRRSLVERVRARDPLARRPLRRRGRPDDRRGPGPPGPASCVLRARHRKVREADRPAHPPLPRSSRRVPRAPRAPGGLTAGQTRGRRPEERASKLDCVALSGGLIMRRLFVAFAVSTVPDRGSVRPDRETQLQPRGRRPDEERLRPPGLARRNLGGLQRAHSGPQGGPQHLRHLDDAVGRPGVRAVDDEQGLRDARRAGARTASTWPSSRAATTTTTPPRSGSFRAPAARPRKSPRKREASRTSTGPRTASAWFSSFRIPNRMPSDDEGGSKKKKTKKPIVIDRYQFKSDGDGYLGQAPQPPVDPGSSPRASRRS